MTFEEWIGDRIESMSSHEYAAEKAAWEAGYIVGVNDVPIAEYEPPQGYVLVPVEPTETVVEAIMKRTNYYSSKAGVALYKAMIQAAQEEE